MTTLHTPRLLLRRARSSDLDALHAILSDAETTRFWSTGPHGSLATTQEWLRAMIESAPEESEDFVIEYEGSVVGKVGFFRLPEIGFILRSDLWGRGLVTEAASAVIEHVFQTRDVHELQADVDPRNVASIRVLERLGFVETPLCQRRVRQLPVEINVPSAPTASTACGRTASTSLADADRPPGDDASPLL